MKEKGNSLTKFGLAVKKRLWERGMTQKALAAAVGVNRDYLSQILYGLKPGKKYKGKIAALLEIEIDAA